MRQTTKDYRNIATLAIFTERPLSKKYEVIKSLSDEYTVNILCEALKVAKGSYHNHILRNKNGNTKAANRKAEMLPVIEQINKAFHQK